LPTLGPKVYRLNRRAYGRSPAQSIRLTWDWLARPYRDLVILKRITFGREDPEMWRLVEKNVDGINALRASGKSYIIATAHFLRETLFSLSLPSRIGGHPVHSSNFPPSQPETFEELRSHIQSWNLVRAVRAWDKNAELVFVGVDPLPFRTLYRRLCEPGNVMFIHVDAWAKKAPVGTYERPFAFVKKRVFATGAAQLARTAGCPIISCVHSLQADGTILLEWGEPIHHVDNDIAVMDKLIDPIEIAIGQRPAQYPFRIGGDRRWNQTALKWEDLPN
jgi:lauroyl/myristoyl acyltransferase